GGKVRSGPARGREEGTGGRGLGGAELPRFSPGPATQPAVPRLPDPHQMRSGRPGDNGLIGSVAGPGCPPASAWTTPAPAIAARNRSTLAWLYSVSLVPSGGLYPNASAPR